VLGAGFCALTFLLLVDFVTVGLVGKEPVLELADNLVALVILLDEEVRSGCEDASLSKVGAR
jgi:hypothetical protein